MWVLQELSLFKTLQGMEADLRHEIHLLAKRQETWFRGMERRGVPTAWLDLGDGTDPSGVSRAIDALTLDWEQRKGSHG